MTIAEQESSEVDESVGTADRVSGRENAVLRLSETEAASLSLDPTDDTVSYTHLTLPTKA